MLCQNCNEEDASTHIKQVKNGEVVQMHLCSNCASEFGYEDLLASFPINFPSILGSFFQESTLALAPESQDICEVCGSSFEEIIRTGKVGCANCYEKFYEKLLPSIERIHGRSKHAGKVPVLTPTLPKKKSKEAQLSDFQTQMNEAIEKMDFEKAAFIRDKMKQIKEDTV